MTQDRKEELDLITDKMWTSKQMWTAISSVAVGAVFLTLIYARFIYVEKNDSTQDDKHNADIEVLTNRVENHKGVSNKADADFLVTLNELEDVIQVMQVEMAALKAVSHHPNSTKVK